MSATGNDVKTINVPDQLSKIVSIRFTPELLPAYSNLSSVLEMATGRFVLIIGDQYPLSVRSIQSLVTELQEVRIPTVGLLHYADEITAGGNITLDQVFLRAGMLSGIILPNEIDLSRQVHRIAEAFPGTIYPQIPLLTSMAVTHDVRFFESPRVRRPDRHGTNPFRSLASRPKNFGLRERLFWLATMRSKFSRSQIVRIELNLGIWIAEVFRANLRPWPRDSLAMLLENFKLGSRHPLTGLGICYGLLLSRSLRVWLLRFFSASRVGRE